MADTAGSAGAEGDAPEPVRPRGPVDRLLGLTVAATLFFLMGVTLIDVIMRHVLPGAFPAANELTKLGLGLLIFAALPMVTARREHVVISLFDGLISARGRRIKQVVIDLAGAAIIGVLAWRLALLALSFQSYDDKTTYLAAPIAPFAWFMTACAVWTALLLIWLAWRDARPRPAVQ